MDEEKMKKLIEINKGIKDLPEMIEINDTINEKFAKMLEEVNGYLIDKREKVKSNMAKETIDDLITNNFKQLIEIKEGRDYKNGKKI